MGRSRASKEQLKDNGTVCKSRYKMGGETDHWMQDAHPKKGALHREMGIPMDHKIPTYKLEKAAQSSNKLLNKRANLALRYRGL